MRPNISKKNVVVFFMTAIVAQLSIAAETCPKTFDAVLSQQLAALDNRDLEAYMSTIPSRQDQLVILPNGSTWSTRDEIEKGHAEWFKDKAWVFNRELMRKDVRETWGLAVYHVSVDRPESPGKPFLLSMMFAPEQDGCWYLQHDQNTLLSQIDSE